MHIALEDMCYELNNVFLDIFKQVFKLLLLFSELLKCALYLPTSIYLG